MHAHHIYNTSSTHRTATRETSTSNLGGYLESAREHEVSLGVPSPGGRGGDPLRTEAPDLRRQSRVRRREKPAEGGHVGWD